MLSTPVGPAVPSLLQHLARTDRGIARATERLASGLRINRAADDPAGLQIVTRMNAQLSGMQAAHRNTQDGQALIQVADGALGQVSEILGQVRDLAVQYRNGTLSGADRARIQTQANELMASVAQIEQGASYNGIGLLDGSGGTRDIVVSPDGGQVAVQTIDLSATMGQTTFNLSSGSVLDQIDAAAENVTGARAQFGAAANRLEHHAELLLDQQEAVLGAQQRIQGADMALEASRLAGLQIRKEAQIALLAQASQNAGLVLKLLER